ncbi:MAG: D-alanyl-D-alanine carboxypeptidase [Selenomonadaceae bacterium]|nr:D-alanyl-D-alanine carboxypeptidase [Selenomonadaceae bacterium]
MKKFLFTIITVVILAMNTITLAENLPTDSENQKISTEELPNTFTQDETLQKPLEETEKEIPLQDVKLPKNEKGEPIITAESAIVIEASTGRVIYEKNAKAKQEPASMTKMLTGIIALETLTPSEEVKVSLDAALTEDVYLNWGEGDSLSASDMIKAMMIVSENGAAVALAEKISGSVPRFANIMNAKAEDIGCTNSHFVTPNGLHNPNHYSTAEDMARIAAYCMRNEDFRKIVAIDKMPLHWITPKDKTDELENTNKLLNEYRGLTGIKTGWTSAAGACLAASAKRDGIELITIIMHSETNDGRFIEAANLLDYGFEQVKMIEAVNRENSVRKIFVKGGKNATLHVGLDEDLKFPLVGDEKKELLNVTYKLPKIVDAEGNINKGDEIGELVLSYNGKEMKTMPLVAYEKIDEGFSFGSLLVTIISPFIDK